MFVAKCLQKPKMSRNWLFFKILKAPGPIFSIMFPDSKNKKAVIGPGSFKPNAENHRFFQKPRNSQKNSRVNFDRFCLIPAGGRLDFGVEICPTYAKTNKQTKIMVKLLPTFSNMWPKKRQHYQKNDQHIATILNNFEMFKHVANISPKYCYLNPPESTFILSMFCFS